MSLVDKAVAAKKASERAERKGKGRAYDEVWCMFDVDEHPRLREAIEKASANGVHLAITNPCIELWFILHFEDQTAYLTRQAAQKKCEQLLNCGKALTRAATDQLVETYPAARDRALRLDAKHEGDGSAVGSNPSSGVWALIDSISMKSP